MSTDKDNENNNENNNKNSSENKTIGSIDFSAFDTELENLVNVIAELTSRQGVDNANGLNYKQKETDDCKKVQFGDESVNGINRKKGRVIKKLDLQKVREAIEEATELKKKRSNRKRDA